ncbi:DUF3040 domain-containing protein [Streptomyces sp. NBC_00445]|uniref:DUF3040 domain-containing protein n=1 Tax=unclassified Streptomyces TaxID=2593676 RepID=UPI002E1F9C97|nr:MULTISPECIES: DUF3040 domain-containing protein [unclassified Streptomyces]
MSPGRDEEHVLAQLERRLAQDDPALAATMDALNEQFSDEPEEQSADGHEEEEKEREKQHNRWLTAITVFAVIAFLGLFLIAVLNSDPRQADKNPGPPKGLAPGVSVHTRRHRPPGTAPRRRLPGPAADICPPTHRVVGAVHHGSLK